MDFSGKLSLYDFLTMLSCGFMILLIFLNIFSCEYDWNDNMIITLILSYFIGLIYHRILEFIRDVISSDKEIYDNKYLGTIFTSNNIYALEKARGGDCKQGLLLIIKDEYYKAYYSIMDKPCYSNIKLLEAQEAFLRNITWVLPIFTIMFFCIPCCCSCYTPILLKSLHITCGISFLQGYYVLLFILVLFIAIVFDRFLFLLLAFGGTVFAILVFNSHYIGILLSVGIYFLILFIRYHTQMKIYKLVWEGYKYTHNKE